MNPNSSVCSQYIKHISEPKWLQCHPFIQIYLVFFVLSKFKECTPHHTTPPLLPHSPTHSSCLYISIYLYTGVDLLPVRRRVVLAPGRAGLVVGGAVGQDGLFWGFGELNAETFGDVECDVAVWIK